MAKRAIFEKKNVLVTGGAGFIGSHLCDELIKQNKVICVDNYITGSERNIDHLLANPNFEFIKHDLIEPLDLEKLPELEKFKVKFQGLQEIYHLACPTSQKQLNKFPIETALTNSHGTRNALEWARKYQAKFVHFSTSAVYGEPLEEGSFPESYWGFVNPLSPRACYDEGKRFAETLVLNYREKFDLDAKIVRIFRTYGPRMKLTDGRLIPDFVNSAFSDQDIKIYGRGNQAITLCYIDDIVDVIMRLMKTEEKGPINLGSNKTYTVLEVAEKVIELTESKTKIIYRDPLPYITKPGIPDISLAKKKLGWFPVIDLEEGLRRTIKEMKGESHIIGLSSTKIKY